jgi:hypothetical protein
MVCDGFASNCELHPGVETRTTRCETAFDWCIPMATSMSPTLVMLLLEIPAMDVMASHRAANPVLSKNENRLRSQNISEDLIKITMMMLKLTLLLLFGTVTVLTAFTPTTKDRPSLRLQSTAKEQHFKHMEELAHKLRLQVFDVDSGTF